MKRDKKVKNTEIKADRLFIKQDFDKAMKTYESALSKDISDEYSAILHLKTARMYLSLLDYSASIPHYEKAMELNNELFTPTDVCNYLDALRYNGEKVQAIKVARLYAYKDVYNQDQRYLNLVHALDYEGGMMPVGVPEYNVERIDKLSTPYSEFWVGKMGEEFFFATSNSRFHDPNKRFYHRSKYYSTNEKSEFYLHAKPQKGQKVKRQILHMIPIDMQNGPLSFSEDQTKMIVTSVSYDLKGEQIKVDENGVDVFKTKLYYSQYVPKRNAWTAFVPAFPQLEGASYTHPFLFNGDQSVLFCSDMDGGYGGYDIYVAHYDEKTGRWGDPINLGPQVNTEGDEISPSIYGDMLVFSSNGHVGFGGYDIYNIIYENGHVVHGSLKHFDYPINSVLNDFSLVHIDEDRGYIISDRMRTDKDDIFYFERNRLFIKDDLIYGMSEADAVSSGAINLIASEGDHNKHRLEKLPGYHLRPEYMLSVYFDFDKSFINDAAEESLDLWLSSTDFSMVGSLVIDGYADEMGKAEYNLRLSERRAASVAKWLEEHGIDIPVLVTGKGQVAAPEEDPDSYEAQRYQSESRYGSSYANAWDYRIWKNRKARRVEIKAILK